MVCWIVRLLQIAGPIWGTLIFIRDVYQPAQAYQAGEMVASWEGFYGPLLVNLATSLLSFSLTFVAPQWRPILTWIRDRLPKKSDETSATGLSQLIAAAFREQQENGVKSSRNLLAQLNGRADRENMEKTAGEKLQQELQRILQELKGGTPRKIPSGLRCDCDACALCRGLSL
ncbi:MAG: hypothetical protein U0903_00810 [Planctomycetales bacterium]